MGKIITEILVFMIMIVLTSGVILLLVQSGIITVKAENEQVPILNAEFIPMGREGSLAIKSFKFCGDVDNNYNCIGEKKEFSIGDKVYFTFIVESSNYGGEVKIAENYRLLGPANQVLLEVDDSNNYNFNSQNNKAEEINFKDYFVTEEGDPAGKYTINLIIQNPLINKKVTLTKEVNIK